MKSESLVRDPAFYDIFGVVAFIFIGYVALSGLLSDGNLQEWHLFILLIISILGIIVDSLMVYKRFFS